MTISAPLAPELVVERGLELLAAQGDTDHDTVLELLEALTIRTGRSLDELSLLVAIDELTFADLTNLTSPA